MKSFIKKQMLLFVLSTVAVLFFCMSAVSALPPDSVYNISDMSTGTISQDTQIGDFSIIAATDGNTAIAVDGNKKTSTTTGIKYTKRLKLNGTGNQTNRAIKFTASEPATFMIEAASANSSAVRTGVLVNSAGETVASGEFASGLTYKKMTVPEAGDYWFYSTDSGINVYYLKLTYEVQPPDPVYDFEDLNGVVLEPMNTIYTAPKASAEGKGTQNEPMSIASAILNIAPGGTIYCSGEYQFDNCLVIGADNSGQDGKEKRIECSDDTLFNFSGEPYSNDVGTNVRGVQINGSYWYIKGLEAYQAADNGFFIAGKHNTLELCVANGNRDTGIQISRRASTVTNFNDWPSDNLILNCTSFDSFDPATGENADGFAAKLTCGNNNVFDGCIAYNNCDDGWDCFTKTATGPIGSLVMRNCVAFRSGQTTDGKFTENCDGNGFKMGGTKIAVAHSLYNCIAFENANHGFTDNSNPGPITLTNCTSYNNALKGGTNKSNFDFARLPESNNSLTNCLSYAPQQICSDKFIGSMKNSVFYNKDKKIYYFYEDMPYTNWNSKEGTILPSDTMETVSNSTFVSVEVPEFGANVHKLWRNPDGSINMGNFLKVADGTTYKDRQIGADLSGDPTILPTPDPTSSPTPSAQPDVTASPSPSSEPKPEYKLLAAVNDGDMNTIDVEFDNNTSIQVEPYIVIAAYKIVEGEEILSDIFDQSYNVEANNSIIFSKAFSDSEYDIIKVFAWQNPNSMIPFDASVNIYPQTEQIIN